MATQVVNIELPEEIYLRLKDVATTTHRSLEDVIFQTIRGNLPPVLADLAPEHRSLVADLQRLGDVDLWVIGKESVPTPQWRRHRHLLHKGEQGPLTPVEQAELTALREATDRFVTRRSYALALLKWRGHSIPAIP
ncbi:MAG: hypothetical protein JWO59_3301 [Chloroflexi bacterium]|nr:hypothetical protein [Chloroflexota bacterium]